MAIARAKMGKIRATGHIKGPDGRIKGTLTLEKDMTPEKAAELGLKEGENLKQKREEEDNG